MKGHPHNEHLLPYQTILRRDNWIRILARQRTSVLLTYMVSKQQCGYSRLLRWNAGFELEFLQGLTFPLTLDKLNDEQKTCWLCIPLGMRYLDAYKDERQEEIRSLQTDVVEPLAAPTDKHAEKEKLPKSSLVHFQTQQCSFTN